MGTNVKHIRLLTTILLILPYFLLIVPGVLFFITLFPCSVLLLIIHFFLGRKRRKARVMMNEFDNIKIFIGFGGLVLGFVLLAVFFLIYS